MKPDTKVIPDASRDAAYWKSFIIRFWSKVRAGDNGCLEWTASRDSMGYGHISVAGKMRKAHRVAYFIRHGDLPSGLTADHLCRNKRCVNPDHLEMVTHAENIRRYSSLITTCKRGHPFDAVNSNGARICRTCDNKRYGEWYRAHRRAAR